MTQAAILRSIEAAVTCLCRQQDTDGRWEDFELPVGRSDAWVTAFTGFALAEAGRRLGIEACLRAAARAASWLADRRAYPAGWGYNAVTGPDADSTAYALRVLRLMRCDIADTDEDWLAARWIPEHGFSTYDRPDNWGRAHPDVTPVAYAAMSSRSRCRLRPDVLYCLNTTREADGTWPAFWWRTRHYSTFLNCRLLCRLHPDAHVSAPVVDTDESRAIHSAFDLAWVAGNVWMFSGDSETTQAMTEELLSLQRPNGSWPGAPILRVARHDSVDPWSHPEGNLYADVNDVFTTASVVRVLTNVATVWTAAL